MAYKLTVKRLREILAEAEDDAVVVVPGHDHSYDDADAQVTTILREKPGQYTEDYGESITPEREYGTRIPAVVIS